MYTNPQTMNDIDYNWLLANRALMYASTKMTREQGHKIFEIYNKISQKPMNYTTCGSCVRSVIRLLRQEFENYTTTK